MSRHLEKRREIGSEHDSPTVFFEIGMGLALMLLIGLISELALRLF